MEREQARCEARAAAEEAAAAELTFVRLCEFCGRSKFKNIMSYGQHKRYCFDVLCKGLAATAAGGGALKVRLRVGDILEQEGEMDAAGVSAADGRRRGGRQLSPSVCRGRQPSGLQSSICAPQSLTCTSC